MFTYFLSNVGSQDDYLMIYKILAKSPEDCTEEDFTGLLETFKAAEDKSEIVLTDALLSILCYCGFGLDSYKPAVFEKFYSKVLAPAGYPDAMSDVIDLVSCLRELSEVERPTKEEVLDYYERLLTITATMDDEYLVAGAKRLFLNMTMNLFAILRGTTVIQELTSSLLESKVTLDEAAAIASDLHLFEKR